MPKQYDSRLPPKMIQRLERLTESDRKVEASIMLGDYEVRTVRFERQAKKLAQEWLVGQEENHKAICEELREIINTGDLPRRNGNGTIRAS